jgi:CRP-like cAMP-binding protein
MSLLSTTGAGRGGLTLARGQIVETRARVTLGRRGIALLSQAPVFAGLSHRHLRGIADVAEEVRFAPDRLIVQSGSPGNTFYVIAAGRAKVFKGVVPTGRPIAELDAGDFFGEMALLDGAPRSASVVSATDLVTIRLGRTAFRKLLLDEPEIALRVLETMAKRIREHERSATL